MTRDASQIERDDRPAGSIAIVLGNIYFLSSAQLRNVAGSSLARGEEEVVLKIDRASRFRERVRSETSRPREEDEREQRKGGGGGDRQGVSSIIKQASSCTTRQRHAELMFH